MLYAEIIVLVQNFSCGLGLGLGACGMVWYGIVEFNVPLDTV